MRASAVEISDWGSVSEPFSLTRRHPAPTAAAKANCRSFFWCGSFRCSHDGAGRHFVDLCEFLEVELLRVRRRLERKRVGRDRASVSQSLMRSVYCGAPATVLLVMTYLRGIGRGPVSTQSCQSASALRKARCSHSTPSMTPWPICLASMTSSVSVSKALVSSRSAPGASTRVRSRSRSIRSVD